MLRAPLPILQGHGQGAAGSDVAAAIGALGGDGRTGPAQGQVVAGKGGRHAAVLLLAHQALALRRRVALLVEQLQSRAVLIRHLQAPSLKHDPRGAFLCPLKHNTQVQMSKQLHLHVATYSRQHTLNVARLCKLQHVEIV